MKFFALFILMCFSIQTVDVPPAAAAKSTKTCCARQICLCKHAKGAPCDYKAHKAIEQAKLKAASSKGDCPFHKGMKAGEMNLHGKTQTVRVKTAAQKQTDAGFTQSPCHRNTPKSLLPTTVRDYEPPLSFELSGARTFQIWFQNDSKHYLSPGLSGPDHPPRVLFSF